MPSMATFGDGALGWQAGRVAEGCTWESCLSLWLVHLSLPAASVPLYYPSVADTNFESRVELYGRITPP